MKKYYLAILILAASLLSVIGFQKNGRGISKTNAPQDLRNEKAIEQLKKDGGFDSLSEAFKAARYKIERGGDTLIAKNPANQMTAQFDENGALQLSGAATGAQWNAAWKLKSLGRGSKQTAIGKGVLQSNGSRVENRRGEIGLTEYFENRRTGLEQGFILDEKPLGEENLRLVLQTNGELTAEASADGQKIVLSDTTGAEVLRYEKLKVWDAENKDLTARMTTGAAGEIRLEVEDREAVYPLTIDPIFVQRQKLTASDGAASDNFGQSLAISGDTAVIGAYGDSSYRGAAYIFVRSGSAWTQQAKLTASDGSAFDSFGNSTAIAGNTIIVGAKGDTIGANNGQGSAYIFVRSGTAWTQQAKLVASDGSAGDLFGIGVDITNTLSGPIAVIGASVANVGGNPDQGSVYVFTRGQLNTWSQTQKLIASDGDGYANFGHSVSIAPTTGSIIIVGAYIDNVGSNSSQGAAYIFKRTSSVWTQQQKLTASDGASNDTFAGSVGISGETAIVGVAYSNVGSNIDQGAAYIFDLTNGASPFDFDGDGKTDVSIFRPTNNQWWYYRSSDGITKAANFGTGSDRLVPGDFTGDGRSDIAFFRPSNGNWFILRSEDNSFFSFPFGALGDTPAPGDYDGDGRFDAGVFRSSNATWYLNRSTAGVAIQQFGISGDKSVPNVFVP